MTIEASTARRTIEGKLVDRCEIRRDVPGAGDDVLNEATLQLVAPSLDSTLVYRGVCLVGNLSQRGESGSARRGGQDTYERRRKARIPIDATLPAIGDVLTVLDCDDDALVDEVFTIVDVTTGRHQASRTVELVDRARGPRT